MLQKTKINYRKLVCHCWKVFKATSLCKSAASACWTAAVFFFEVFDELPVLLDDLSLENSAYEPEKLHAFNVLRYPLKILQNLLPPKLQRRGLVF